MKLKQVNNNFFSNVYEIVKKIPKGKVSSYSDIANLLGKPRASRAVGFALNALKKDSFQKVPWQRVINKKGEISFKGDTIRATLQKKILTKEGIIFDKNDRIDLDKFKWP